MTIPNRHEDRLLQNESAEKLFNHVRAIEVLEEQKAEIADDIKARKDLAKSDGFDTNILAAIIKRRKIGEGETKKADSLIVMYEEALRDQGALPLEQTRVLQPVRRSTEEIAQALHGKPPPPTVAEIAEKAAAEFRKTHPDVTVKVHNPLFDRDDNDQRDPF